MPAFSVLSAIIVVLVVVVVVCEHEEEEEEGSTDAAGSAEWWSECGVRSIFVLTDKQPRRSRDTSLERHENTLRVASPESTPAWHPQTTLPGCRVYSEKLLNVTRRNDTSFDRTTNIVEWSIIADAAWYLLRNSASSMKRIKQYAQTVVYLSL